MAIIDIQEKTVRITEILEQIDKLNNIIEVHRTHGGDASSIAQYQYIKKEFTVELSGLLHDFQLTPHFLELAA